MCTGPESAACATAHRNNNYFSGSLSCPSLTKVPTLLALATQAFLRGGAYRKDRRFQPSSHIFLKINIGREIKQTTKRNGKQRANIFLTESWWQERKLSYGVKAKGLGFEQNRWIDVYVSTEEDWYSSISSHFFSQIYPLQLQLF